MIRNTLSTCLISLLPLLWLGQSFAQGTFSPFAWQHVSEAVGGAGYLTKTGTNNTRWNAGGQTWQVLGTDEDGIVKMSVSQSENWEEAGVAFGFQLAGVAREPLTLDQLPFALVVQDQLIMVYESGRWIADLGSCEAGNMLEIHRSGGEISYWINEAPIYTSEVHTGVALTGAVRLLMPNASISGLEANFSQPLAVTATLSHTACTAASDNGTALLNITGGVPPYAVVWNDGTTGMVRSSLAAGMYTATIQDQIGNTATQPVEIKSAVIWGILSGGGAYTTEDTLFAADAGAAAFSENLIHENEAGRMAWTVPASLPDLTLGWATTANSPSATDPDFGFQILDHRGYLWSYGEIIADIDEIRAGDVLALVRDEEGISFYLNDTYLYMEEATAATHKSFGVLTKVPAMGKIAGVSADFGCGSFFITLREVPPGTTLQVQGAGINTTLMGENLAAGGIKKFTPTEPLSAEGTPITLTLSTPVGGVTRSLVMNTTLDRNARIGRVKTTVSESEGGQTILIEVPVANISFPTAQSLFIENPGQLVEWGFGQDWCNWENYQYHTNPYWIGIIDGLGGSRNWVYSISYGENALPYGSPEKLINESITYYDGLGRVTQVQGKNYTENRILAAQPIYDAFGRAALQTLPAPLPATQCAFAFDAQFMTNAAGQPYSFKDYDLDGTSTLPGMSANNKRDPAPVNVASTLGQYYGQNSEEPFLSSTAYPFVRSYASDAGVAWGSGVGESHRLGNANNNESKSYSFPVLQELDHYVSNRHTYGLGKSSAEATTTLCKKAIKQVGRDADGNESVAFYDFSGNLLATCQAGGPTTTPPIILTNIVDISNKNFIDLHITNNATTINFISTSYSPCTLNIKNIVNDELIDFRNYSQNTYADYSIVAWNQQQALSLDRGFYRIYISGGLGTATISYPAYYHNFQYNYYDKAGRLKTEVQPKADVSATVEELYGSNPSTWRTSSFEYHAWYAVRADLHDEGTSLTIHGPDGRVRFTQNNDQYDRNLCSYINYDPITGRVSETGILDLTQAGLLFEGESIYAVYPTLTSGKAAYVNYLAETQANVVNTASTRERSRSFYDTPDPALTALFNSYWGNVFKQKFVSGTLSATEYIANNTGSTLGNTKTWYSYDELGRLTWTVQRIEMGTTHKVNTVEYQYDLWGNVIWVAHNRPFKKENSYHRYTYDLDSRMVRAEFSIDGTRWREEAQYDYYLHGPLRRTELAETLQGIDYTYTTAGGLKSINNAWLTNDPGQDGTGARAAFAPDVFGTTLDYYEGDYTRNGTNIALRNGDYGTSKWTGLIASERWATSNAPGFAPVAMQMKAYTYDRDGQLTQSLFGAFAQTGIPANPWDFTANGNFDYKETFLYDRNGNLKELTRNATATTVGTTPISNATDALVYHYDATPGKRNRLQKITDNAPAANDGKRGDIRNQTSSTNYFYQSDGKVYTDLSEDAWYVYNGFGELEAVYNVVLVGTTPTKGTRLRERYYYDDGGMRLMRETWTWHLGDEPSHIKVTTATRTWYIRDAGGAVLDVYEQNWVCSTSCMAPVFSQSPVIKETYLYAQTRLGVFRRTGLTDGTETSYELTDHLGNVRSVIQRRRNGTAVVVEQRTDYYAHGWAMPGRDVHLTSNGYRFAYQGIELDPATGNHFFELRTFDARTARWTNPDPLMQCFSPYLAMLNNPVSMVDPNGGSGFSFDLGTAIGAVTFLAHISYSKGNGAGDPLNSHSDWMDAPDRAGGWSIDWGAAWENSAAASMAVGGGPGDPPPGAEARVAAMYQILNQYKANGTLYSQPSRQWGLGAEYADCSSAVLSGLELCGQRELLFGTDSRTIHMRATVRDVWKVEYRQSDPQRGDFIFWQGKGEEGHVAMVLEVNAKGQIKLGQMGVENKSTILKSFISYDGIQIYGGKKTLLGFVTPPSFLFPAPPPPPLPPPSPLPLSPRGFSGLPTPLTPSTPNAPAPLQVELPTPVRSTGIKRGIELLHKVIYR